MAGWDGSVWLSATSGSYVFNAAVDYGVYAPGQFNLTFPGSDPSNNTRYVYAYQFFDSATGGTPSSNISIKQFSVHLDGNEQAANEGELADPLGSAGLPALYPATPSASSAVWTYTGTVANVAPGQKSEILFFTSPFAPERGITAMQVTHSLNVNGTPATGNGLPNPTPEPASLLLLATAAGLWGLRGVLRRRFCR
jgi:hypothetical protein